MLFQSIWRESKICEEGELGSGNEYTKVILVSYSIRVRDCTCLSYTHYVLSCSPQLDVNFSPDNAYLDVYPNQNGQYFANNLTDEMFQSVRDADSMLLTNVDANAELPQIQVLYIIVHNSRR
jgi:hypothetical protein